MRGVGHARSVDGVTRPTPDTSPSSTSSRGRLGLPILALIGLALLAVPRIVLHDLGLISEGTAINSVLVFLPPLVWIGVVLWRRVPNPFVTLLVVGVFHGVLLALTHQLLWSRGLAGSPPRLGGNLAGLDPGLQEGIIRSFAAVSSLFTGIIVGVIAGLVAWGLRAVTRSVRG